MKYRKKPVEINAFEYIGNVAALERWYKNVRVDEDVSFFKHFIKRKDEVYIKTLEGEMHVSRGDFVIQGVAGEYYPCKPNIFYKTYEESPG